MVLERTFRIFALEKSLPNIAHCDTDKLFIPFAHEIADFFSYYSTNTAKILCFGIFCLFSSYVCFSFSFCCLSSIPFDFDRLSPSFLLHLFVSFAFTRSFFPLSVNFSNVLLRSEGFFSPMLKIIKLLFYDLIHFNAFTH